jgi:predicted phosphodiesterase
MKVASFSDSHGQMYLPVVEDDTDIICIAGDIIPLNVQSSDEYSYVWFVDEFLRWAKELNPNVKKIFLVAGNHDKYFEHIGANAIKEIIAKEGLSDKVIYLEDETYIYEGYKITGSPWIKNLPRWSFNSDNLT